MCLEVASRSKPVIHACMLPFAGMQLEIGALVMSPSGDGMRWGKT